MAREFIFVLLNRVAWWKYSSGIMQKIDVLIKQQVGSWSMPSGGLLDWV
jgi:hypothetical protein